MSCVDTFNHMITNNKYNLSTGKYMHSHSHTGIHYKHSNVYHRTIKCKYTREYTNMHPIIRLSKYTHRCVHKAHAPMYVNKYRHV